MALHKIIRKFPELYSSSKVTKILLVKDHACQGKELFCVKTIESTCATLAVGHFKKMNNWFDQFL